MAVMRSKHSNNFQLPNGSLGTRTNKTMNRYFQFVMLCTILLSCEQQEEGIHPTYRNITEAVYGTATVEPRQSYTVYPAINGIIETSFLKEGEQVEKGEELIKISSRQAELNRKKAQLNLDQAQEGYQGEIVILQEIAERIASARKKHVHDSLNYARQARLWQQNIGSLQQYESMKLAYETSGNLVRELQLSHQRTERELANQVALANNALDVSQRNFVDHSVRAAMSGTIYRVFKDIGESVGPQTPVAEIGSSEDFLIKILVDEVDIAKVNVGQEVILLLDAYGTVPFIAVIQRILPLKEARSQTFTVEAEFKEAPPKLFSGLSGEANIVIAQRANILTLPSQYITPDNQVRTASGLQQITPGLSDLSFTEIVSGLGAEEMVYQVE